MTRPNPHRVRRLLWCLDGVLALVLVGLTATTALALPAPRADDGEDLRAAWQHRRLTGLRWTPRMPVADAEADAVLFRFRDHTPAHFPFVGPPQPLPVTQQPTAKAGPAGLEALGRIAMLAAGATDPVVGFAFREAPGRTIPFGRGEIIRQHRHDPAHFRLERVETMRPQVYRIHYSVLEDGAVIRKAYLPYTTEGPVVQGGGLTYESGDDVPPQRGQSLVLDDAAPRPPRSKFRPRVHVSAHDPRLRAVHVDRATTAWVTHGGVARLAGSIKTQVATDKVTGRTLGLRVTGLAAGTPATAFEVRPGDILLSINGQTVASRADAIRIAKTLNRDDLVTLVVDRRGTQFTYRLDPSTDARHLRAMRGFENIR